VQTLTLYIAGISHVLNSGGMVVQLESEDAADAAAEPAAASAPAAAPAAGAAAASSKKGSGRRYSVAQINTSIADVPSHPHDVAHQMAARRPTLMALSAASTLLLMEEGREFARYTTTEQGEVVKEMALVFFQPATGAAPTEQDALFWASPAQGRVPLATQRIRIGEISDLYLGKQVSELKSPAAAAAPHSNCMSIVSKATGVSLSLCAPSLELLSAYMFGLNRLIGGQGRDITLDESADAKPASARHVESRRFSVVPAKAGAVPAALEATLGVTVAEGGSAAASERRHSIPTTDANVVAMLAGSVFWLYTASLDTGIVSRHQINLWYETHGVGLGTLYYCNVDMVPRAAHASRSLPLSTLTDIFNLHQSRLFASDRGVVEGSIPKHCLTLVSPLKELDIEAVEEGVAEQWMEGLRTLLTSTGRRIEEEQAEAEPISAAAQLGSPTNAAFVEPGTMNRHIVVLPALPTASPAGSSGSDGAHNARVPSSRRTSSSSLAAASSVLSLSAFDMQSLLKTGAPFERFLYDSWTHKVERFSCWLYYRENASGLGAGCLHWTEQDPPIDTSELYPDSEHTLRVADLTELALGKTADVFQKIDQPLIAAADSARCFSITGSPAPGQIMSLHLQAASVESRQSWIQGINGLLATAAGRRTLVASDDGSDDAAAAAGALGQSDSPTSRARASDAAERELASNEMADVLSGSAELSEEERRAVLEQTHGTRRRFSVQGTAVTAGTPALPEIVENPAEDSE